MFLDVAAVQGGGEQGTRADDVPSAVVTQRHLEATRSIEPDDELDLVVWPENVVDVSDFAGSAELEAIATEARRLGVPISVGVTEDVPGEADRFTNAQVIVTPDGEVSSRYDKVRRVPFGEYVPLRGLLDALGAPLDQVPHDAVAGTGPAVLDLPDGTRLGVVISWEVFFGGPGSRRRPGGWRCHPQPDERGELLRARSCRPSRSHRAGYAPWRREGRVVQVAPTGFSAVRDPRRRRPSAHRRQRSGGDPRHGRAARRRNVVHPPRRRADHHPDGRRSGGVVGAGDSRSTVTGPSLTSETRIAVRNLPVATAAPRSPRVLTTWSTSGAACSGRAAAIQLGRRPAMASPYSVNWLTTRIPAPTSLSRAVHHSGFVVEDAQVPHLAGDPLGIRPGVVMGHPDEDAQPRANRPDNLGRLVDARSSDSHRGFGHSLHHGAHRPMVSTNRQA